MKKGIKFLRFKRSQLNFIFQKVWTFKISR